MKAGGYTSYDEFLTDKAKLESQPNDTSLIQAITSRIQNSDLGLREKIKDELSGKMMEEDFHAFLKMVLRDVDPRCWVIIKSKTDPWFEC